MKGETTTQNPRTPVLTALCRMGLKQKGIGQTVLAMTSVKISFQMLLTFRSPLLSSSAASCGGGGLMPGPGRVFFPIYNAKTAQTHLVQRPFSVKTFELPTEMN